MKHSGIILFWITLIVAPFLLQAQEEKNILLYKNCGNYFTAKRLGFDPAIDKVRISGGELLPDRYREGFYYLIPDSTVLLMHIRRNYEAEKSYSFEVINTPIPYVELMLDNQMLKSGKALDCKNMGINLAVKLTVDADFEKYFPKESRFKVAEGKVRFLRNNTEVFSLSMDDGFGMLYQAKGVIQKGDVMEVSITKLKRVNYKYEVFEIPVQIPTFTFKLK